MTQDLRDTYSRDLWDAEGLTPSSPWTAWHSTTCECLRAGTLPSAQLQVLSPGPAHSGYYRRHMCVPLKGLRAGGAGPSLGNLGQQLKEVKGNGEASEEALHSHPVQRLPATGQNLEKRVMTTESVCRRLLRSPVLTGAGSQTGKVSPLFPPLPQALVPESI